MLANAQFDAKRRLQLTERLESRMSLLTRHAPTWRPPRPPTVPPCAKRTVPKFSADGPPENQRLGSTFARIFDRPIDPRKGTKGRRKDDGKPGGEIKGALCKLGRIGRRADSSVDSKGRILVTILSKADTVGSIDWISRPSPNFDQQDQSSWDFDGLFAGAGIFAQN